LHFCIWFFNVSKDITFWIIFISLKYIGLDLDLGQSFKKKTSTNICELQHMEYICDKIILVTEYEKLHTYFKLGLWVEFFDEFVCGHYYRYTLIESRAIWKFKVFG